MGVWKCPNCGSEHGFDLLGKGIVKCQGCNALLVLDGEGILRDFPDPRKERNEQARIK